MGNKGKVRWQRKATGPRGRSSGRAVRPSSAAPRYVRLWLHALPAHVSGKASCWLFPVWIRLIDHSLFCFFTAFNACFALVQLGCAVLTTEVPATAAACHEGHPDSIVGFALITLTGTAGFGHRYVSMTGRLSSQNILRMMWRLLQDVARVCHPMSAPLLTHRCSTLQFKTDMCCSSSFQSRRPRCELPLIAIRVS